MLDDFPLPVIGTRPSPRVLLFGSSRIAALEPALASIAPTVKYVSYLSEVNQSEWDAVVTDMPPARPTRGTRGLSFNQDSAVLDKHLCVVWIVGDLNFSGLMELIGDSGHRIVQETGIVCNEFINRPFPGAGDSFNRLVADTLLPHAARRSAHDCFQLPTESDRLVDGVIPLGMLRSFQALAVIYPRTPTSETLALPDDIPDIVPWVEAALWRWHDLSPTKYPRLNDWRQAPEWRTTAELELVEQINDTEAAHTAAIAAHTIKLDELRAQLSTAAENADRNERALLTDQGDELVAAVTNALTQLGFNVKNMDGEKTSKDQRLEDLRVTDPDEPDWLAVVEVRGYKGGAKTSDFQRIARFVERMIKNGENIPERRWYIVNQLLERPPEQRGPTLAQAKDDVEAFAESGGAVINTVELFRIQRDVRSGTVTAADARTRIRSATGVFASDEDAQG